MKNEFVGTPFSSVDLLGIPTLRGKTPHTLRRLTISWPEETRRWAQELAHIPRERRFPVVARLAIAPEKSDEHRFYTNFSAQLALLPEEDLQNLMTVLQQSTP